VPLAGLVPAGCRNSGITVSSRTGEEQQAAPRQRRFRAKKCRNFHPNQTLNMGPAASPSPSCSAGRFGVVGVTNAGYAISLFGFWTRAAPAICFGPLFSGLSRHGGALGRARELCGAGGVDAHVKGVSQRECSKTRAALRFL